MPKNTKKQRAEQIKELYQNSNNSFRRQWEFINQKGFDFSNDNQLTDNERKALEDQGMPTFTINRIAPVVEMLNFYATANTPRWQAIGAEGSDSDVAAAMADLMDYVWYNSDGTSLYANAVNDSISKSLGFLMISVNQDSDNGMGDVVITQPDPFDVYIDNKSRDLLFRDASYILIRKILSKSQLYRLFPDHKAKITKAQGEYNENFGYSEKSIGKMDQKDFHYKDFNAGDAYKSDGTQDDLVELFEVYEKVKVSYINLFFRVPPDTRQLEQIKKQTNVMLQEMQKELQVLYEEELVRLEMAVQSGEILESRFNLEAEKAEKQMQEQLQAGEQEITSKLQAQVERIENSVISEKEFKELMKEPRFAENVVDTIQFFGVRIRQTIVAGDQVLEEVVLPDTITEYPIIPFHYKWTGTPLPLSAVAPLIGKQREINKAHQLMVHNASLGSSLRWLHEEGSIDSEYWEKYSSAPGALLPIRPGSTAPTPVMPAPLSNAFFGVVQEGKTDMEYLAGIYSSMQGDSSQAAETYRGMMALDEYGTRRVKQWLKNSIEPALRMVGRVIMSFSQAVYTAEKRFRILQPSALQEEKDVQINIPMYNDMGQVIGKTMDISAHKYDIRVIAGSTMPVNRWAYLEELKGLMQLGVVDDIAVLAETNLKHKEKIAERKSQYAQMQSQIAQLDEAVKDKDGTIETLERQLVQAGIKGKIQQASVEIDKKKHELKSSLQNTYDETETKQKLMRSAMANNADTQQARVKMAAENQIKQNSLQNSEETS